MKLWEIYRFEVAYQMRRIWTWVFFAVLFALSFLIATQVVVGEARGGRYAVNSPFVIASISTITSLMTLLVTATFAGEAGARDTQTRMEPLVYTLPISKVAYLGGRFLAAFTVNALVLLAVPLALMLATVTPVVDAEMLDPFRPGVYFSAFIVISLSNAFVATAFLFSISALSRHAIAGYLGAVLFFFLTVLVWELIAGQLGYWETGKIIEPLGLTIVREISQTTTPLQKNIFSIESNTSFVLNRAVWLSLAAAVLAFTYVRFRFNHPGTGARRKFISSKLGELRDRAVTPSVPVVVPQINREFGGTTRIYQILTIATQAFREIALSWGGLFLGIMTAILVVLSPLAMKRMVNVPILPTTRTVIEYVAGDGNIIWMTIPLLIVYYVGELIWRDRDTGLSSIADAAPVPEWVQLLGKYLGVALILICFLAFLLIACMIIQTRLGYYDFEIGLYVQILFGLLLPEYLLLTAMAFAVHVLVNQKYVGHMIALIVIVLSAFAPQFGIEHKLLAYSAAPGWTYSDLRGFGLSIEPWLWFKLYWGAWALLFMVGAKIFWVRGRHEGICSRLRLARQRLIGSRSTLGIAAAAAILIIMLGGFIYYNTNVLNNYETASDKMGQRAEYERHYGQYKGIPQPILNGVKLRVEIYPERREAEIHGSYRLVNRSEVGIDSIHLATALEVETELSDFDRPAKFVLDDARLGHRIYALETPLFPGGSIQLNFVVRFKPRGFTNDGINSSVATDGTFFDGKDWLPAVGYQSVRELRGAGERSVHELPARLPDVQTLDDFIKHPNMAGNTRITLETIMGTSENQIAVAPGELRRTWTENGRRYFQYATDTPIRNNFAFYSAAYAVSEGKWKDVAIQIFHHPRHALNVARMIQSVEASLDYFTKHFGHYPHRVIRLVERPGDWVAIDSAPVNMSYEEDFSLFNSNADPRAIDFPFAAVAHETAHQWWGNQLSPANTEGSPLLTESLAWYSAMCVVRKTYGDEHLRRLLGVFREDFLTADKRSARPLLQASDQFWAYRKGPFAMYTLLEYVGADRVNAALRNLFEKHRTGASPLPASLDLYRELRAVTPEPLHYLLADLFEKNTFWELKAKDATVKQIESGSWEVTLDLQTRKVAVDIAGVETNIPMDDLIEIGVYAAGADGKLGESLYLQMHRIRSGEQRLTVTVPMEPARAGIDPRNLLIDVNPDDNFKEITQP